MKHAFSLMCLFLVACPAGATNIYTSPTPQEKSDDSDRKVAEVAKPGETGKGEVTPETDDDDDVSPGVDSGVDSAPNAPVDSGTDSPVDSGTTSEAGDAPDPTKDCVRQTNLDQQDCAGLANWRCNKQIQPKPVCTPKGFDGAGYVFCCQE